MPTIVFAKPKGCADRLPSAVILAFELARKGTAVPVISTNPNRSFTALGQAPGPATAPRGHIRCHRGKRDRRAREGRRPCPPRIVDLEGTASMTVAYAISSRADPVIIPSQGSQFEAAKAIRLICQQERAFARRIPHTVLFICTSTAIRPRTLQHIRGEFEAHGVPAHKTQMHEREAYRTAFSFGGTVNTLNATQVSGLEGAHCNARAFAAEVVALLRQAQTAEAAA